MHPECSIMNLEVPDAQCPTTLFSDWSPCSATCGNGIQIRTRLLLVEPTMKATCENRMELNQQRQCSETTKCHMDMEQMKANCQLPAVAGPCRSEYTRFAYDSRARTCVGFTYGGCRGNENNFLTFEECMNACQPAMAEENKAIIEENLPVDCILSGWSDWTPCSVSCGIGKSEKYRHVLQEAKNGGQPCPPRRIFKSRKCFAPQC